MGNDSELWELPLEGERKPQLLLPHNSIVFVAQLSPDEHWLAYSSLESGSPELYVVPFRGGQGKWQVSAHGGGQAQWSRDGKQLYYMDLANNIFTVPVKEVGGALQFGNAEQLISTTNWSGPQPFYDVNPDGKKILLERVAQQVGQSVTVVTNFTEGLKK